MARLGDVCEILNGFAFKSEQYVNSGIRIIRISNVQKGYIEDNTPVFYPIENRDAQKYMLSDGDLLISLTGNVGRVALLEEKFLPAALNQRVACLRVKNEATLNKKFLFDFLNTDCFEKMCIASSKGVAQKNMSTEWLKKCEIPLLPLQRQLQIAYTLDTLSSLISLRRQQLAKLEELVKARFVEMFSACTQKDKLGNMVSISRGASPRPISAYVTEDIDGVNWIKIGDVSENSLYIERTKEKITLEGAKKSRYVYKGDFILSNSMSFGRPYILNIDGCVHDGWLIISDYLATFHPLYLYYAIRDFEVQRQFSEKVNGATVKNLNSDLVKSTLIKVPPMELQRQFSESVLKMEQTKLTIQQSLDKLELLKKSLMQEFFG